jgi:DNA-binding NarL/FixJ family response regulator
VNVLIIDDSEYKIAELRAFLETFARDVSIATAKSYQTAQKALKENRFDLVLLDMTLPTSEKASGELEGRDRIYGGRDLLAEMEFNDIQAKVILVTQFDKFGEPPHSITLDTLLSQLKKRFSDRFVGGVYYNNVDSRWIDNLTQLLRECSAPK